MKVLMNFSIPGWLSTYLLLVCWLSDNGLHDLDLRFSFPDCFWVMETGSEVVEVPGFGKQTEFFRHIVRAII